MPIYLYVCEVCGNKLKMRRGLREAMPLCCGRGMTRKFKETNMLLPRTGEGGVRIHSKGYKEGYAKDYAKDVPTPWNS